MPKASRYTVTGPLVVVPAPDGSDRFYYEGDTLPDDIDEALLDRLVDGGAAKAAPTPRPAADSDKS